MYKIFEDSWNILKNNPKLYYVPILMFFIAIFINPFEASSSFTGTLSFIGISLTNIALHTGWLNQIFTIIKEKEKTVNFEHVLIGIGKFFSKVLNIYILLFVFLIFTLEIFSFFIKRNLSISQKELKILIDKFNNLTDINYQSIMSIINSISTDTLANLNYFLKYFALYVLIISTIYFFISLWNYILVFKEDYLYKSLLISARLISKKIFSFTFLTCIDFLVNTLVVFLIFNSKSELLSFVFLVLKIIVQTFFTIAFCIFVEKNKLIL